MRVFVSSSFADLQEHRAAAIRVLRQLGHDVIAMEDMTAGSVAPLPKVLEMVDRAEAYVGIFAWRYGCMPPQPKPRAAQPPAVKDAIAGDTSITHYEYLRAVERKLPILAFLLDESFAWPPRLVDGFETAAANAERDTSRIRALRAALQQERVVSWFTTPSDLEARVSAAITMAGLTGQLDLQPATTLDAATGVAGDSTATKGIQQAIRDAGDAQRALKIDLKSTWWSTRLYLVAALAERFTGVRRVLVVDSRQATPAGAVPPTPAPPSVRHEQFVGQVSTASILSVIRPMVPALNQFDAALRARPTAFRVLDTEIVQILNLWRKAFGDPPGQHQQELAARVDITADVLRRWFGEALLRQPVRIADLQRASVVDLLRLLDYPSDYIPVVRRLPPQAGASPEERVEVMDKAALNARLARSYLVELMDRARIT